MDNGTGSSADTATPLPSSSMVNPSERPTAEFSGASDETIAEAVRRALARASTAFHTLEGAGVLVIPHVYRRGVTPRYRVTLKVTAPPQNGATTPHPSNGTS